jgi:hypothetical protein
VRPLEATLTVSPNPAIRNQPTTFAGAASGSQGPTLIDKYNLEFGDGDAVVRRAGATTISAQHVYASAGAYVATLTITNNTGDTATVSTPVAVHEQ